VPVLKSPLVKERFTTALKSPSVPLYKEGGLAVPALKPPLVKERFREIYNGT
jgi:hypothetical protein